MSRDKSRTRNGLDFAFSEDFLCRIRELATYLPALSIPVRRLTIEVTKYCDIGCEFCKYHVRKSTSSPTSQKLTLTDEGVAECLSYINEHRVPATVITGGGEPTYEMGIVTRIIRETSSPNIQLYTAGQWGLPRPGAVDMLRILQGALNSRDSPAVLTLRLSVDDFHERQIGLDPWLEIITAFQANAKKLPDVTISLRTVLRYDGAVHRLAECLEADLTKLGDGRAILVSKPPVVKIDVLAMNLVPAGKVSISRQSEYRFESAAKVFEMSERNFGPAWPLIFDGGLNIGIRPSGKVYAYGGTPEDFGRLPDRSLNSVVQDLAADPVNREVYESGLDSIVQLLNAAEPQLISTLGNMSDPPLIIPTLLKSPHRLLFVKLWCIGLQLERGSISLSPASRKMLTSSLLGDLGVGSKEWFSALWKLYRDYTLPERASTR